MHAVADSASSVVEELAGARNVLLLTPSLDDGDGEACSSLLSAVPEGRADACIAAVRNTASQLQLSTEWQRA